MEDHVSWLGLADSAGKNETGELLQFQCALEMKNTHKMGLLLPDSSMVYTT